MGPLKKNKKSFFRNLVLHPFLKNKSGAAEVKISRPSGIIINQVSHNVHHLAPWHFYERLSIFALVPHASRSFLAAKYT